MTTCARAAGDVIVDEVVVDDIEQIAADAVADYQVEGSLFQQITDLEQEKVDPLQAEICHLREKLFNVEKEIENLKNNKK